MEAPCGEVQPWQGAPAEPLPIIESLEPMLSEIILVY